MKPLLLLIFLLPLIGCSALRGDSAGETTAAEDVRTPPTDLEGPTYDPTNSPEPMTASTPLPGSTPAASGPATYSSPGPPSEPTADGTYPQGEPTVYNSPATAPTTYGSAPAEAPVAYGQTMEPKGATTTLSPAAASIAPILAGDWYNADDQREVVRFTPTHYTTFYDGELIVEEDMQFHEICPGDCRAGEPAEFSCFTISGPGGQTCYGIIRLTDQLLELSMLGVSTETIIYQKLP